MSRVWSQYPRELDIPLRIIARDEIASCLIEYKESEFVRKSIGVGAVCEPAAILGGRKTKLVLTKQKFSGITVAIAVEKLYVVGTGPGRLDDMSIRAVNALKSSDLIVGYKLYLDLIADIIDGKPTFSSGMRKEIDRAKEAVRAAVEGKIVSIVSSGDPGVYGMAGLVLEIVNESDVDLTVEVIAGIPSANAAASILGSPLMHDHVIISLSDLLTPWETIENRLELAAKGDFVIAIYKPHKQETGLADKKSVRNLFEI